MASPWVSIKPYELCDRFVAATAHALEPAGTHDAEMFNEDGGDNKDQPPVGPSRPCLFPPIHRTPSRGGNIGNTVTIGGVTHRRPRRQHRELPGRTPRPMLPRYRVTGG